jgi:3-hydroxybutyryl-CoA dehydrogenase
MIGFTSACNFAILYAVVIPIISKIANGPLGEPNDPHTIDKTWMKSFGSPKGPFAILDIIGITTVYNVAKVNAEASPMMARIMERLENEFISQNKLGLPTGQGFYSYPNPAYESATFLK